MMVAAFFVGTEIAQAADISFSGSVRTRYENEKRGAFTESTSSNDLTATQVRLNAKANISADTSAFIQMQSNRTWGNATSNAYTASDGDATVGIHQAYFTLKNFAGTGVAAKVGRQEVVLDGHRLFGHTGWTTGAQTHDAVRLTHSHDNMTMNYVMSHSVEGTNAGSADLDIQTHLIHNNFQGVLGGNLSTYVVYTDDSCGVNSNACTIGQDNQWYTLGGRQAGKMYGLDYRAEAYWQLGKAGGAGNQISQATTSHHLGAGNTIAGFTDQGVKRDAYMFGVRVGKKLNNVTWSPKVTLWYDYLSGNNDENMNKGEWSAFDTHFDTGHKFYGFMDMFLNNTGANTNWLGLQDAAIKVVMKPAAGWTLKADWHHFLTAESIGGNPGLATRTGLLTINTSGATDDTKTLVGVQNRGLGNHLGDELDFTLVHAYNANTKLSFGYSLFMAETLYHAVDANSNANGLSNNAHWAYVQAAVKF